MTGPILLNAFKIPSSPKITVMITNIVSATAPTPEGSHNCWATVELAPPHMTTKLI